MAFSNDVSLGQEVIRQRHHCSVVGGFSIQERVEKALPPQCQGAVAVRRKSDQEFPVAPMTSKIENLLPLFEQDARLIGRWQEKTGKKHITGHCSREEIVRFCTGM